MLVYLKLAVLTAFVLYKADGLPYTAYSYEPDFLDMDPDSILEENAVITTNATCGVNRREYYCRLVEHADGALLYRRPNRDKRQTITYRQPVREQLTQPQSYRDPSGHWIQCSFCDDRDPLLRHPIEYVLRGESHLWWQSPSLAEGLKYHSVTITMDFTQVYQIVYVLLRMGDSPRPANWILERSLDDINYKPWVFFAESEYDCKRLYQPLLDSPLTVTSGPRPWKLEDDEVYCTTFYSQPQALQSGEIIITLSLDRSSTLSGPAGLERAISAKLIDFLSARFVRLRFQKLQTLSGDWMAMPNQLDSSVYNRYYYSIRTIKVGGKCLCNSHANRCEQRVVDGVPRAICVCQHNTCGSNCEICCPMFNQQLWRPGRVCEECNCHGKADSCVFNQTVANLRLSKRKDGVFEGGGVCVDCREDTIGVNCESCKPGYYRPINVRPEASFPCVKCECDTFGSTGECVSNDAKVPEQYPGDCICKDGFAGKRCDQCAEGYRRSDTDPMQCVPCTCDVRGSHRGGGYKCEPPCNCKINVNPDSNCRLCLAGHFNLDVDNPEGCQACYCSGLTNQCDGVSPITALTLERNGLLGVVSTLVDWKIVIPSMPADSGYPIPYVDSPIGEELPLSADIRTVESWLGSASSRNVDRGYYWTAPKDYLGKQIAAYRNHLIVILRFNSPTMVSLFGLASAEVLSGRTPYNSLVVRDQLENMWLNEPDVVLEGNGYRLAYILPVTHRDSHLIIDLRLHESSFRVLVEPPSSVPVDRIPIGMSQGTVGSATGQFGDPVRGFQQAGRPATVVDLIAVLSKLDRLLIKAKYISDQNTIELRQVRLVRAERDPEGRIPGLEECICPAGHTGTSCESCAFGYWRDPNRKSEMDGNRAVRGMWRDVHVPPICIPCECNGHSAHCDEQTGRCIDCQHNTAGDKCDRCAPGFYGDPSSGSPSACQPCECPTLTNQKTDSCIAHETALSTDMKSYICLDCEDNTRGRYCERCAQGYYGQPDKGISCRLCDCDRGAVGCNETTGQCICGYNTAGPRCEACAEGTHGNPLIGQACRPCNCHEKGSVSLSCRAGDGQCFCNPGYEGLRCDRCTAGRGNVDAGCPPCQCSPIGTRPEARSTCDPTTGQCACKPGVGGTLDCSKCAPGFYNLGPNGCQECECSNRAVDLVCDPVDGRCKCGTNVLGDRCEKCKSGHFWNVTGPNCLPCECGVGTAPSGKLIDTIDCDMQTGQCICAPHVTGRQCTECKPGYYGVSSKGCKPCPMCPNGQVCDQVTGKCICPPNTQGDRCEECSPGSWDYNAITGCKMCNCSLVGTKPDSTQSCDSVSGQCQCQQGYAGRACDQCETGHYGYPDCKPCECDARGTLRANGTVLVKTVCNQTDGSCFCKPNVQDTHCDTCKPSTFGLNIDYPLGCYSCFCFPTSTPAKCSLLTGYRSVPGKEKGIEIIATDRESVPGGALIQLSIGLKGEVSDDLSIGVSQFSWRFSAHRPTFLEVPELRGQLTRNYGTVLIAIITECLPTGDCALSPPDSPYATEMLVANGGANIDTAGSLIVRRPYRIDARMVALNGQLHLEYQPADDAHGTLVDGYRQIWLREADWVLTRVVGVDTRVRPSRRELMLALLNVTSFSVRLFMPEANPKLVSVKYRVYEALSETATLAGTQIRSVEKCDCPVTSSGDHCEVASSGFYFPELVPKPGPSILPPQPDVLPPTVPENIIWRGGVEKCRCHGMSSRCDPNTGVCEACTGNTMGPDCGQCTTGYMGDPKKGQPCVKCQCPTEQTDYALTCFPAVDRPYVSHQCVCKPGYSGLRCERCAPGYFGDPTSMIACQPCDCDMDGSKSASCAQDTGQCSCWPGIFGRRCDQCEPDHVVDAGRCIDCRGECTGELLLKADSVKTHIDNLNVTSLAYQGVARLSQQADSVAKRFSPERVQKEEDLIQQVQQLARETSMARDATDQARRMRDALELARCQAQANLTNVNQAIERFDTRVKDWIDRVQELPLTVPDPLVLQRWLEEARRVRTELNAIKLNATHDAMSKLQKEVEKVIESAKDLTQTVRPGRSAIELRRLEAYQQQQRKLLELQTAQLYGIGNATQKASKELGLAQTKSNALKKAATDAADLNTIHKFETNVTKLRELLDGMSELPSEKVKKLVDDAKLALQNITSVDLIDLDRINIPPNLESDVIRPLEREADAIRITLQFSIKVNQTIQALDAYQTIIDNMRRATNATMQAEDALKESAAAESQTWQELLEQVTQKNEDITSLLDESAEVLQNHNKTLNLATKQLVEASSDLDEIQKTADKTLSDAQEVNSKISVIKQLLTDTEPQAQNVSAMTGSQMEKMSELRDRLQSVENRYAKLQGTAQSTVDQANNTLLNLVKSISETETTVKQLDTKLLRLRRLADEARSLLDVSYGALAKDPVPLRLNRDCVYSLVPYALTKSRVFDIEFWFRLHPEQSQMNSVLMIGRRAFAGRTQMFAFTLESSNTKLRFSWNVMNGKLELNAIRTGIWYQVRVTSVSGETRMMLIERPDEEKPNSGSQPTAREVSTRAGANHPEAALMLDRQMEIRIGGALQPGSRLVNPEAWGVNGAETLWSRLLSMDATQFCIFNLRVGGVTMSIVDLATASPSCKQPSRLDCQLRFNYRPLARNGYVWRPQNELTDVTTETRPPQSLQTNYLLKRLFYYDFAGTGGYARIEEFKDLKFCEDRVQFQLTPLTDAQRNPMMVFTFFNYDKDTGVTVELVKGIPKATKWTGDQLYRSQHEPGLLDVTEVFRRRVLRTTTSSSDYGTRVRRNMGTEDKRAVSITQSELTVRIWRLDELLPTDCTDKVVMFLGAIPPGHYSLRRRMIELGLTLNPFVGRIGITNEKPSQDGSLFLEEYVNAPVARLGDTHFTDLQQRGETLVVSNLKPDLQYCLQFSPDSADTRLEVDELKLDKSKLRSPWEPGITMTVRFNPTVAPTEDIVLLRLQMASAEWLTISITTDYRLGLGIPGATSKLFTHESLTDRPLDDPAYALNELEIAEARMINASVPAWKELISSEADNPDSGLPPLTTDKFEVTITLHFSKANSQRLHVLFDQRLVQSWTIPSQANVGPIEQALIGPFTKMKQPITISYLVIGTHLVDFAAELSIAEGKPGVHIGVCGGQLHPRFLRRVGPLGILWVAQGLDLPPPPGGRRLRFVEMLAENATLPDVSQLPSMPADSRLRREEDCATNPSKTAWFDQTANSFWEINDLGSRLEDIEPPFEFTIGFRAQLSQGSKAMVDPETSKVENAVTGVQYNLLAAFNYGPERGNLYVLLSESQIIVTDSKRVLWSSPHLTISDSSWHRLTLAIPKNDILNDLNGVESGVYIIFDGRHLWLPKVSSNGVPILAFIGGLPSTLKLTLPPNENIAPVTNMFGCVDELVINGIEINPRISGRPTCYDCFSLDPNMIHVPESIRNYMKTELIPLQIPPAFLQSNLKQMTFDFSFFYDRDTLKSANLFVLVFEDEDTGKLVHVILYLANTEIRMAFVDGDEPLTDYSNSASLLNLPRNKNTWHFVKLDMILAYNSIVLMLRSQIAQSLPLVLEDVQRLKAIYFSQNKVITLESMKGILNSVTGTPFIGCLRDIRIRTATDVGSLQFPSEVPGLLKGVCHTSVVW